MIPVTQTKVVVRNTKGEMVVRGNCYAAAIASILELPIDEVPNVEVLFHIESEPLWATTMHAFLESKGYELFTNSDYKCFHTAFTNENYSHLARLQEELKDKYYLVSGDSPRGVKHICIYRNGKMVHDPHPTREGLLTEEIFEEIVLKPKTPPHENI
jgi:hypothetical protein